MNVGLDTSVVLRLLVGKPDDQVARAVAFLDELERKGDTPVVSDLVVTEVCFALQHHYGLSKTAALSGIGKLFAADEVKPTGTAARILKTPNLATAKPGFVDRLIHLGYLDGNNRMATFEKAAGKLKNTRVL